MKKNILALLVIFILILSVFTGCQKETGLSIEERIRAFVKDLNGPRLNIRDHFHNSSSFSNINNAVILTTFPLGSTYGVKSISTVSSLSSSTRSVDITKSGSGDINGVIFVMREEGKDDWYINNITYVNLP